MKDENMKNTIFGYVVNILLGIIGFFIVMNFNQNNETLKNINKDIISINKEILDLRLEITDISNKMMTDERVRELIKLELSN